MITWKIPAKTFLVGEYAALTGACAIVLTTKPCFSFSLQCGDVSTQAFKQNFFHPGIMKIRIAVWRSSDFHMNANPILTMPARA